MENPSESGSVTAVQEMESPEGRVFGFGLLDDETMKPCFRLAFATAQDAERGRAMMEEIVQHCLWYEVYDFVRQKWV